MERLVMDAKEDINWFAACDGITRMGPFGSELAAYHALRLAPRESATRIVATDFRAPDLGLRLLAVDEIKDGTLAPGARVWAESAARRGAARAARRGP